MAGEAWKKLSDAQKKPYEKKYAEVFAEYQKDGWRGMEEAQRCPEEALREKVCRGLCGVSERWLERHGRSSAMPRRSPTRKSMPRSLRSIRKMAGEAWKKLSDAQKKPYEKKYAE